MFRDVGPKVNYAKMEEGVIEFWHRTDAFRKTEKLRRGGPVYTFYEGPPTANGLPHIGHVLPRSIKDLFPRYKTMLGYYVPRKAGWDTHGLPVELEVEKKLGITSKPEIEKYGVEDFIRQCKESVWKYEKEWEKLTERIGFWLDMEHAYVTYHESYIESVWWALKQIWDKGWLYQGHRVVPYCARCGTSLSSHEVAQGYEDVEDPSVFVRFPLAKMAAGAEKAAAGAASKGAARKGAAKRGAARAVTAGAAGAPGVWTTSLLVWTTTPWTLPSNTAVAAHPDVDYVAAVPQGDEEVLVVAAALAPKLFPQGYNALYTVKGRDLIGSRYRPPFPFFEDQAVGDSGTGGPATDEARADRSKAFTVVPADFVTLEDGTGLVHLAPAFGEDDMEAARRHGLPVFRAVDAAGRFTAEVPPWKGRFVKDADPAIIEALRDKGRLYRSEIYRHTYPFCYRCHAPLLYYADTTWFIKMTAVKDELIRLNRDEVTWHPEHLQEGRFGDWLENLVDWNLSRNRYWGTPLPVWECGGDGGDPDRKAGSAGGENGGRGCGHRVCVGSVEELRKLARPGTLPDPLDLHKPHIDRVVLTCPKCGGAMRRVPEVIDCWFDSGAMPFAQWHYPFENRTEFERNFPADFICEAVDQTRGWFYSLLAIATVLFDRPAYRNVLVTEFGVDEEGRKMSKHIGNVLDPWEILSVQGADALRWFLYAVSHPWVQKRFSSRVISEFQGRMQDTLWNVYSFFALYANLDRFEPDAAAVLASGTAGEGAGSGGKSGAAGAGAKPAAGGVPGPTKARLGGREAEVPPPASRGALDRWILSRLNRTIAEVRGNLDKYQVLPATRAIEAFVDDLSNWYVRRGRRRYWRAGTDQDKVAAYQTLYEVLVALCRLLAPFTPFMTEEMYQNLVRSGAAAQGRADAGGEARVAGAEAQVAGSEARSAGGTNAAAGALPESVHHCFYPAVEKALVDEDLERRMETVRAYVALARAARNRVGIRTRQPLRELVLVGPAADTAGPGHLLDLLSDEVNVKKVAAAADLGPYALYTIKPRFDLLGPRLGPLAPKVARALSRFSPDEAARAARRLAAGESLSVLVEGQETPVILAPGDVEVRTDSRPGWAVEGEDGRYVALSTDISRDLLLEGLAREMVNRIQRMRKEAGFEVEDHIELVYEAAGDVREALAQHRGYVASETLSDKFGEGEVAGAAQAGGAVRSAGAGAAVEPDHPAGGWFAQTLDLEGDVVRVAMRRV